MGEGCRRATGSLPSLGTLLHLRLAGSSSASSSCQGRAGPFPGFGQPPASPFLLEPPVGPWCCCNRGAAAAPGAVPVPSSQPPWGIPPPPPGWTLPRAPDVRHFFQRFFMFTWLRLARGARARGRVLGCTTPQWEGLFPLYLGLNAQNHGPPAVLKSGCPSISRGGSLLSSGGVHPSRSYLAHPSLRPGWGWESCQSPKIQRKVGERRSRREPLCLGWVWR